MGGGLGKSRLPDEGRPRHRRAVLHRRADRDGAQFSARDAPRSRSGRRRAARGRVRAAQGRDDEAEGLLREGVEIIERTQFRIAAVDKYLALAEFLLARGREEGERWYEMSREAGAAVLGVSATIIVALSSPAEAARRKHRQPVYEMASAGRWSILGTFLATLVLSIPLAVAVGVGLSIALYVASSASDVAVRALVRRADGRFAEAEPPARLPSEQVTVLDVYGSLFFAGAQTLREALPSPEGASRPVVVLRLRGRTRIGSTLIDVLDDYADDLRDVGGRLYLSGVHADVAAQLRRAGKLELEREVWVARADEIIGDSTTAAIAEANAWLGTDASRKAGAS